MRQSCSPYMGGSLQKHPCCLQSCGLPCREESTTHYKKIPCHTIFVSCCFSCSLKENFLWLNIPKLKSGTRSFDLTLSLCYSRLCTGQETKPVDAWIPFVLWEMCQDRDQQLRRDTAGRQQEMPQPQPEGLLEVIA